MRIGFLTDATIEQLDWAKQNGFGSVEWMRFETSFAGPQNQGWRFDADRFAGEAKARDIRVSAIGALYQNPLNPAQSEFARTTFQRAIDVAAHIGVKTVAGFPGAVIEFKTNPKGQNQVYQPFENFLPRLVVFWEPLAK